MRAIYKRMNKEEYETLIRLNKRLKNLQNNLLKEASTLDVQLKKRVEDKSDFLDDYEIELHLNFYLKTDDKDYDESMDNIITSLNEYLKGISVDFKNKSWRWFSNQNEKISKTNNNFTFKENTYTMNNDSHCWWFHCLYDHNHLNIEDLLRIGLIWSDIKVYYQYFNEESK